MKNGPYILIKPPENYPGKRYRDRYAYEHHVVWWMHTGEIIGPDDVIHHKNENKHDNRIENLEKLTRANHASEHAVVVDTIKLICPICDSKFEMMPFNYRYKIKHNKTGNVYCSRSCGTKGAWRLR